MDIRSDSLNSVLRCQMTAVNQQFIHVLALRAWGDVETAERIIQVDRADFPNAMRIIDYLVETETPIGLASDRFTPGANYRSILLAEQVMELRLSAAIEMAACANERARALISAAKGPREAYATWLADRLNKAKFDDAVAAPADPGIAGVIAHLIAIIEQSMVHAFVHWHRGETGDADAAWATSGAAMMQMTELVNMFAARRTVPVPGDSAAPQIAVESIEALDLDRQLAKRCADEAAKAAVGCDETAIADLCRKIAGFYHAMSRWSPEQAHPAVGTNSAVFSSFATTLRKFVR